MRAGGLFLVFGGVAAAIGSVVIQNSTKDTVSVTVTDKERLTSSDADGGATNKYVVFTDKEVFENTDTMIGWKFNSSDVQGMLQKGCDYDLKVYGFRVHWMSMYRNIFSATHKPTPECPSVPQPR